MAGGFGVAGSGGDGTMRGDGHAARISGVAGVGRSPVERQQSIERLDLGPSDPTDDGGQISFRVDGTVERLGVRPPWPVLRLDRRPGTAGRSWTRACR